MEFSLTRAEKKLNIRFRKLVDTEKFQSHIIVVRKNLGLPKDGLMASELDIANLTNHLYWPENQFFIDNAEKGAFLRGLNHAIIDLLKDFTISSSFFRLVTRHYIVFNQLFLHEIRENFYDNSNLCAVIDAKEILNEIISDKSDLDLTDEFIKDTYIQIMRTKTDNYPIVIGLHSDASQRDIIDFVKKNWPLIEIRRLGYKKDGKVGLRHAKTKINTVVQERNRIIYENRKLATKEIRGILAEKQIFLDDGHIRKIISLEKEKREKK